MGTENCHCFKFGKGGKRAVGIIHQNSFSKSRFVPLLKPMIVDPKVTLTLEQSCYDFVFYVHSVLN